MGDDRDTRPEDNAPISTVETLQSPGVTPDGGTSRPSDPPSQPEEMRQLTADQGFEAKDVSADGDKCSKARKPWKQKKKIAQNREVMDEIEIFEGKGVVSGPSHLEITSPENGYLKIICKDDCEFLVPFKVVESFQCVDVILHSDAVFKEKLENVIRFPDIQPEIMEYVLRFVFIEHLNKLKAAQYWGANSPRLVFQFEVDPRQVMDLIYVAHFLGIHDLLNVTATMVARHLRDVPDVSSMPVDLAWCVAEQFSSQELYDAEEREDFLVLSLGTDTLWAKHCKKFLNEDIISPTLSSESPPPYDSWDLCEGPPPTCWKDLFIALDLQQLADRQDGSGNESFFAEVKYKGKYAYTHTIRPMFYDWVLSASGSLPFFSYIAQFPNLLSLHLVKLPLGSPLADGTIPCLVIGEVLESHPLLQILDISETGFTAEAAILLSQSLCSHTRLQVLRLAYNNIGTEGFTAIARALPYVRSLKLLDVRGNGISSSMMEDAVAGLQASALEEILLTGNLKAWKGLYSNPGGSVQSLSELNSIHSSSLQASCPQKVPTLQGIPHNLKTLQLQQCDLVDTDVSIIVDALSQHSIIQKLDLSDNTITAIGAVSIFTWLQDNQSLLELHLSSNRITDSCSQMLLRALQSHKKLQKLSMRGNYSYGEESLHEVINAGAVRGQALLSTCGLRFILDLRRTDISFSTRARIQRGTAEWASQLHLLI